MNGLPTTTEGIAAVMVQIAAEDLGSAIAAALRNNPEHAAAHIESAIRQLDAARRMLV